MVDGAVQISSSSDPDKLWLVRHAVQLPWGVPSGRFRPSEVYNCCWCPLVLALDALLSLHRDLCIVLCKIVGRQKVAECVQYLGAYM